MLARACVLVALALCLGAASAQWSNSVGKRYVNFAFATYCPTVGSWQCPNYCSNAAPNFVMLSTFGNEEHDTFGFVGYDPAQQEIIVAFRGTRPAHLRDWITDLNFAKTTDYEAVPGALVHEGFLEAYEGVQSQVTAAVQAAVSRYPHAALTITGHSLGGALSVLCAADLQNAYSGFNLVTFGCPRVGNSEFASWLSQTVSHVRVVHDADIVPHLPPEALGFRHSATEFWYTNDSDFKECDSSGEDPNCSDGLLLPLSIPDHLRYLGINEDCSLLS